jgi:uncharacterized protein YyaL (SSP411 family)
MGNALAHETSPYLRQHADNPVDWLPWGEEALRRSRERERPLLVSIGYSACHWCHVMERESFEDEQVAALMNEHFVCVKVDREERPDVDAVCMEAVQVMTGHGGWPLNVFLTPDQVPFFGGTYFPPDSRMNMPSWPQILLAVTQAWDERRDEILGQADRLRERLSTSSLLQPSATAPTQAALDDAVAQLRTTFDARLGGWGGAPKFPSADVIDFLLGQGEREMALTTLRAMATGGICDQVGGGFARYSVDATWTVPHFEKMLYDNALLARAYVHGWQVSADPLLRRTAAETIAFVLRELRTPEGAFHAALDADSEGVEGKFYVWSEPQLRSALDEADADAAVAFFGATVRGNFEGTNVLEGRGPAMDDAVRDRVRARLLEARSARIRPALDDKVLTSWNALMIAALADAGAVLERDDLLDAARTAADYLLRVHRDDDGRLLRTSKDGVARLDAYLEDHAFLVEALVVLYEATWEPRWLVEARAIADTMIDRFADPENGGFFTTADDHTVVVARRKDLEDSPIPSGSSSAALGLLRLAALTGDARYEQHAASTLALVGEIAPKHPAAFGHLLQGLAWWVGPVRQVAIVGPADDARELARVVRAQYRSRLVLAGATVDGEGDSDGAAAARAEGNPGPAGEHRPSAPDATPAVPLLEGRHALDGHGAAYVCERFACRRPVTTPGELADALGDPALDG